MVSKKTLASCMLSHSGIGALIRKTTVRNGFLALNYHRVGNLQDQVWDRGVWSASAEGFARQLRFLKSQCDIIVPQDIPYLYYRGKGKYVMITFDDGYRDNYEVAFPLLKEADLQAVFFLATGFLDSSMLSWWDEIAWMVQQSRHDAIGPTVILPLRLPMRGAAAEHSINELLSIYKTLPMDAGAAFLDEIAAATDSGRAPLEMASKTWMTWDMIREMHQAGMVIGGHTVHHPILSTLSRFEQEKEIMCCDSRIEEEIKQPMRYFSYPRGKPDAFNEETRACLYEARVQYAFTYNGGFNLMRKVDPFDMRRVPVESDMAMEHFETLITLPQLFS